MEYNYYIELLKTITIFIPRLDIPKKEQVYLRALNVEKNVKAVSQIEN